MSPASGSGSGETLDLDESEPAVLVHDCEVQLLGLLELGGGTGPGNDNVGFLGYRSRNLGAETFRHGFRLVPGHLFERAGEDDCLAGDRTVGRFWRCFVFDRHIGEEGIERLLVMGGGEELYKGLGDDRTDVADAGELGLGLRVLVDGGLDRRANGCERAIVACKALGRAFAGLSNSKRVKESPKADRAAVLDGLEQVRNTRRTVALASAQRPVARGVTGREGKQIGRALYQIPLVEFLNLLFAESFDIEGLPGYEVDQSFNGLGRAG